jgi:hypothetical protein
VTKVGQRKLEEEKSRGCLSKMVFIYQTGGKIPKEVTHNGLIYRHEWNAKSMSDAKRIGKDRKLFKESMIYIKKIPYARETVYAIYIHHSTTDRILKGTRFEMAGSAPLKTQAVKMGKDIYGRGNYKLIKHPHGYGVWRRKRGKD